MKIIGEKTQFAVEFEITDPIEGMGYARIWFNGAYIGSAKDLIYLKSYLLINLRRIGERSHLHSEAKDDIKSNYPLLENRLQDLNDNEIRKYLISFGTLSDDYTLFSYLTNDNHIVIVWKLTGEFPYFEDINYNDREVKFYKLLKEEYLAQLNTIEQEIMNSLQRKHNSI